MTKTDAAATLATIEEAYAKVGKLATGCRLDCEGKMVASCHESADRICCRCRTELWLFGVRTCLRVRHIHQSDQRFTSSQCWCADTQCPHELSVSSSWWHGHMSVARYKR